MRIISSAPPTNDYVYVDNRQEADVAFSLRPDNLWDIDKNRFGNRIYGITDGALRELVLQYGDQHGRPVKVWKRVMNWGVS